MSHGRNIRRHAAEDATLQVRRTREQVTAARRLEFWRNAYAFWKDEVGKVGDAEANRFYDQAFQMVGREESHLKKMRAAAQGKA